MRGRGRQSEQIQLKKPADLPALSGVEMPTPQAAVSTPQHIRASRALGRLITILLAVLGFAMVGCSAVLIHREFKELRQVRHQHEVNLVKNRIHFYLQDRADLLNAYADLPYYQNLLAWNGPTQPRPESAPVLNVKSEHRIVLLDRHGDIVCSNRQNTDNAYAYTLWFEALNNCEGKYMIALCGHKDRAYWCVGVPVLFKEDKIGYFLKEIPIDDVLSPLEQVTFLERQELAEIYYGTVSELMAGSTEAAGGSFAYWTAPAVPRSLQEVSMVSLYKDLALISIILLLIIALVLIQVVRKVLTQPLEKLRAMTNALLIDHEAKPIQIKSNIHEIQLLFSDFNKMAKAVVARERELEESRASLERRVAERTAELHEGNLHLRSILGAIQSGIMVVDTDTHHIIDANQACCEMLKLSKEEIKNSPCKSFTSCVKHSPDDCCLNQDHFPLNEECILKAADGSAITALKTVVPMVYGGRQHILISFVDISKRKEAQNALEEARRKEIHLAAHIQETLLVGIPPESIGNLKLATLNIPSQQVSGDFFDYHNWIRNPNCLDLIIGDVMGKGINAALLGAGVKTAWHQALVYAMEGDSSFGDILPPTTSIVHQLHLRIVPELIAFEAFITLCYARLDAARQQLEFVHCGHNRAL